MGILWLSSQCNCRCYSPIHGEILRDQEKRENRCSLHGSRGQSRGDSGEGVEGEDLGLDLCFVEEQNFSILIEVCSKNVKPDLDTGMKCSYCLFG